MIVKINSPVLVPFGLNPHDIFYLADLDRDIYIAPQYKFWGKNIELMLNGLPTQSTLDYIYQKYKEDFTGIVKHSKYYGIMKFLFNGITAESMDKLYQIDLDEHQKLVLGIYLTKLLERQMDDVGKLKKPIIDKLYLDYDLKLDIRGMFPYPTLKNISVKMIEDLGDKQFPSIYGNIYRKSRLYTPHYLGFISLFTREKEKILRWEDRLKEVVKNNLMKGGNVILNYPPEYSEKINKLMRINGMKKMNKKVWEKPDIKVKKLDKGIKRYY